MQHFGYIALFVLSLVSAEASGSAGNHKVDVDYAFTKNALYTLLASCAIAGALFSITFLLIW